MTSRFRLAWLLLSILGCPKSESSVRSGRLQVVDAGVTDVEGDRLRAEVRKLSDETRAWSRAVDGKLWTHWTTGAPLDLTPLTQARDAVLATPRRSILDAAADRQAVDPAVLERLAAYLDAEAHALALSKDNEAVTALETTLTFPFEGKDVRWRELNRLLANEKSALKRKSMWLASLPAAEKLDAALATRDARRTEVLAPRSPFSVDAEHRDVDPEAMRRIAEGVLILTEAAWRRTIERLNAADTKLPVASLTRADLPRLLRVPADVELAFGKKELGPRAVATMGALGFYGQPGLTLDLSEAVKKNPLPLTVTPGGPSDVRTSFRPLGGLRDQQLLFSEVGVALALQHVTTGRFEDERLGDSSLAQASGELFASLVGEEAWLEQQGLTGAPRRAVIDAFQTLRLFQARRASAAFLVRLDCVERSDADSRRRAAALFTRAFGVAHTEADMARMRIDSDDAWRSATTLRAMLIADILRNRLNEHAGAPWFTSEPAGRALSELWSAGTSVAVEERVAPLGDAIAAFASRTEELNPSIASDGGWTLAEWGQPKGPALRPFSTARPWPRARITYDGGTPYAPDGGWIMREWPQRKGPALRPWVPRPWPQRHRLAGQPDAG